jgi:putative endonuclease
MEFFVYILENKSKTKLYTGMTNDLERRVGEHNGVGGAKATRPGRPWTLVYQERFEFREHALKREAHIKRLCRSAKQRLVETQGKIGA